MALRANLSAFHSDSILGAWGGGRRAIENSSYADDKKKVQGGDHDQGYDKKKLHDDDAFLYLPSS